LRQKNLLKILVNDAPARSCGNYGCCEVSLELSRVSALRKAFDALNLDNMFML